MITLSGLRKYLSERPQASVAEMAVHFDASADAVRGALQPLAFKGPSAKTRTRPDVLRLRMRLGLQRRGSLQWIG